MVDKDLIQHIRVLKINKINVLNNSNHKIYHRVNSITIPHKLKTKLVRQFVKRILQTT